MSGIASPPFNLPHMNADLLDLDPASLLPPARGRLLVSGPFLSDPYFRRTVVLLCEHDGDGSFGFVLNRMLDTQVGELVPDMQRIHERVCMGGPVNGDNLYFIHTLGMHVKGSNHVVDDVHAGGDHDQLRDLLAADPRLIRHVRFFIGYAGWEAGQLEREIAERSWFVTSASKRVIMSANVDGLWRDTLRAMGQPFAPLANFPDDPGLN
jgi:putative transcriptional regulator